MSGHSNILLSYGEAAAGNGLLTNLEAYWSCNNADISGATLSDVHGIYDGTITGATTGAAGIIDEALSYDASGDYVSMGDVLDFERTDAFSISAWILPDLTQTTAGIIVGKRGAGTTDAGFDINRLGAAFGYGFSFDIGNSFSSNWIWVRATTTGLTTAKYYHVVATYDGSSSASGVTLYVDNTLQSTTTVYDSLSATTLTSYSLQLGARSSSTQLFKGRIDEVGIWSRELSSTDVAALYNSGSGLAYSSFTS